MSRKRLKQRQAIGDTETSSGQNLASKNLWQTQQLQQVEGRQVEKIPLLRFLHSISSDWKCNYLQPNHSTVRYFESESMEIMAKHRFIFQGGSVFFFFPTIVFLSLVNTAAFLDFGGTRDGRESFMISREFHWSDEIKNDSHSWSVLAQIEEQ